MNKLYSIECAFEAEPGKTTIKFGINVNEPTKDLVEELELQTEYEKLMKETVEILRTPLKEVCDITQKFIDEHLLDLSEENADRYAKLAFRKMMKDIEEIFGGKN